MRISLQLMICSLVLLQMMCCLGCAKKTIPDVTSNDSARQALSTALDAWKAGSNTKSLEQSATALYVGDEDWSRGDRLMEYTVIGEGEPFGTNVRFMVDLHLTSARGESIQKRARYIVGTNPVQSVKRDDSEDLEEVSLNGYRPATAFDSES